MKDLSAQDPGELLPVRDLTQGSFMWKERKGGGGRMTSPLMVRGVSKETGSGYTENYCHIMMFLINCI